MPAVPPGLTSSNPHAPINFFECVDYHEHFGTIDLEHYHWYYFKQAILYGKINSRVCVARSHSAWLWGNLYSQEQGGVVASWDFLVLLNPRDGVREFVCDKSTAAKIVDQTAPVHFTYQFSQSTAVSISFKGRRPSSKNNVTFSLYKRSCLWWIDLPSRR